MWPLMSKRFPTPGIKHTKPFDFPLQGMRTMIVHRTLPEEALHTANFFHKMDQLFDKLKVN